MGSEFKKALEEVMKQIDEESASKPPNKGRKKMGKASVTPAAIRKKTHHRYNKNVKK